MFKFIICFAIIYFLSLSVPVHAGENSGGVPGYFLNLGLGTRALSMGRASTALQGDPSSVYWNPAGLATVDSMAVQLSYIGLFENTRYTNAGIAVPRGSVWTYGIGVAQLATDGIVRRDTVNIIGDSINDTSTALFFSNAFKFRQSLSIGFGTKIVNKLFDDYNSTWLGLDLGVLYIPVNKIFLGVNIQNLVHSGGNEIPITAKIGAAARMLNDSFTVSGELEAVNTQLKYHAGVEMEFYRMLAVRGGYDNGIFTAGFGLKLGSYSIDYAVLQHDIFGLSHRAGFTFVFPK